MPSIDLGNRTVELDESGFLRDKNSWDSAVAHAIAEREGIDKLSPERLEIIRFMRAYYEEYNAFPILRSVCKNLHQPRDCVSEEFIDPLKAWKIAGLPNPEVTGTESADEAGKIYRLLVPD